MKTMLYIQNLKCEGCESTIIDKLSKLNNISNVSVDLQHTLVTFNCESKNDIGKVKKRTL